MHKLQRKVRFSVNPFLPEDFTGSNSFSSKPSGEGLAVFFELEVGLVGSVDLDTGFVVNVTDIDKCVREYVVPVFSQRVRKHFGRSEHIGFSEIVELLKLTRDELAGKFGQASVMELSLKLNPFRKLSVDCEDWNMIYFSEKFEFAAMHKLWNESFSEQRNLELFGKCANPTGHGHNYVIEVAVKMPTEENSFRIGNFQKIVDDALIQLIDHKNLNADVPEFKQMNPTIENIAVFAWNKLQGKFSDSKLHCVNVWETDRTYCSYYG